MFKSIISMVSCWLSIGFMTINVLKIVWLYLQDFAIVQQRIHRPGYFARIALSHTIELAPSGT
jgi:hypothetical protein